MKLFQGFPHPPHRPRMAVRAIVGALIFLLPSCRLPHLRTPDLGTTLPASIGGSTEPDSSGLLRVEEFYNDPALTRLICEAVGNNRELKTLEEEIQVARNDILARRGAYLPFVGFVGTAGMGRDSLFMPGGAAESQLLYPPGRNFPDPLGDFLLGFNILWQLDIWREFRNARDAAVQRYQAAIERRNFFVTGLVAEVAEKYYGLMALDQRIENLDTIIRFQQQSYDFAKARFDAGRGTELAVQRFQAEVRKNQSEKLIIRQDIVEVENRINYLLGRFPQPVPRVSDGFLKLTIHALSAGVPAQLLENRPDIRQAERELEAAGLDVKVARARFFPRLDLAAGIGYRAFNPRYLFDPEALAANLAGNLTAPLINRAAIKADYMSANARQLESLYKYQGLILNAFAEVVNRFSMVENYRRSIEIKQQQLTALEASVDTSTKLFLNARVEYIEVLFAQRDLLEAKMVLIDTKRQQLSAIVNAYQALGGGYLMTCPAPDQRLQDQPQPPAPQKDMNLPEPPKLPGAKTEPRKDKVAP